MARLFDTHCHFIDLDVETQSALRSLSSPIELLSVSKSTQDWLVNLDVCSKSPNLYPALGIHPWYINQNSDLQKDMTNLRGLCSSHLVKVLGEVGLDYGAKYVDTRSIQNQYFEAQVALSVDLKASLSIHCHKAFSDVLSLLKTHQVSHAIMHGFSGSFEQSKPFISAGYKLGVGTQLLNSKSSKYERLVANVPLDALLLETDAPYGSNGQDLMIIDRLSAIAQRVANIKKIPVEEVFASTYHSARFILGIHEDVN